MHWFSIILICYLDMANRNDYIIIFMDVVFKPVKNAKNLFPYLYASRLYRRDYVNFGFYCFIIHFPGYIRRPDRLPW